MSVKKEDKVTGEEPVKEEPKMVQDVKEAPAPAPVPAPVPLTIELGDLVRDVTSGYEGIVIGIAAYLFGDSSVQLQQYLQHRPKYEEPLWFNGRQLKLIEKAKAQKVMG